MKAHSSAVDDGNLGGFAAVPPMAGNQLRACGNIIGPRQRNGLQQPLRIILHFELFDRNAVNGHDPAGDDWQRLELSAHSWLLR